MQRWVRNGAIKRLHISAKNVSIRTRKGTPEFRGGPQFTTSKEMMTLVMQN